MIEVVNFSDIQRNDDALIECARSGDADGLRQWKNIGVASPQKLYRQALDAAVSNNHIDCVTILLKSPHFYNTNIYNELLLLSTVNNNPDLVAILLHRANPQFDYNLPLRVATINEFHQVFDLLYSVSDPLEAQRIMRQFDEHPQTLLDTRIERERLNAGLEHMGTPLEKSSRKL